MSDEMPKEIFVGYLGGGKIWGAWTETTHPSNAKYIRSDVSAFNWQPIETYDGRPALVSDGVNVAAFCDGYMPWNEGRKIAFFKTAPTHWLQIPNFPVPDQEQKAENKADAVEMIPGGNEDGRFLKVTGYLKKQPTWKMVVIDGKMHTGWYFGGRGEKTEYTDVPIVSGKLTLSSYGRGRSSATFEWVDESGYSYHCAMKHSLEMFKLSCNGVISGSFTFSKQGDQLSIRPYNGE
jgi:hypothetical protein